MAEIKVSSPVFKLEISEEEQITVENTTEGCSQFYTHEIKRACFFEGTLQLYHKVCLGAEIVGRTLVACVIQENRAHSCTCLCWECVNHVLVQYKA